MGWGWAGWEVDGRATCAIHPQDRRDGRGSSPHVLHTAPRTSAIASFEHSFGLLLSGDEVGDARTPPRVESNSTCRLRFLLVAAGKWEAAADALVNVGVVVGAGEGVVVGVVAAVGTEAGPGAPVECA